MRRPEKCVGKKKYAYTYLAIDSAKKQYIQYGVKCGVYECPTCLDFHLTTKYCNLQHHHKDWDRTKLWIKQNIKNSLAVRKRKRAARRKKKKSQKPPAPVVPKKVKPKTIFSGDINAILKPYQRPKTFLWRLKELLAQISQRCI